MAKAAQSATPAESGGVKSRSLRSNPMEYKSSTHGAYERLRADLLACRFKPGERLPINDLCQDLGVSLGAVREALSRLTSDGLVSSVPQRGFRAAPISAVDLQDLTYVRIEIEELCIKRAFAAGDLAWEARVVAAYHQLSRTPTRAPHDSQRANDAFTSAHSRFHEEIVSPCDSPWLLRLRATLFAQSERYRALSFPLNRKERDVNTEHRKLVDAVVSRDLGKAVELMRAHIEKTTRILLDAVADGDLGQQFSKKPRTQAKAVRADEPRAAAAK